VTDAEKQNIDGARIQNEFEFVKWMPVLELDESRELCWVKSRHAWKQKSCERIGTKYFEGKKARTY
jgi:hypothetical protein